MFDLPPPNLSIEIVVASRGMSQGTAQTKGVQLLGKASVQFGDVLIGGQWKNLTSPFADGVAMGFATLRHKRGPLQLTFRAAYKFQTNARRKTDSDGFELTVGFNRSFGRLGLKGSVDYSSDDVGRTRRSFYFEGGPTVTIGTSTKLIATIGRREQIGNPDYTSFSAGVSTNLSNRVAIELRYYGTNRSELGEPFPGRTVVTARLTH